MCIRDSGKDITCFSERRRSLILAHADHRLAALPQTAGQLSKITVAGYQTESLQLPGIELSLIHIWGRAGDRQEARGASGTSGLGTDPSHDPVLQKIGTEIPDLGIGQRGRSGAA